MSLEELIKETPADRIRLDNDLRAAYLALKVIFEKN